MPSNLVDNMKWDDLSMAERAKYIKLGLDNNITDLKVVRDTYNKYAEGGDLEYYDYMEKLAEKKAKDWNMPSDVALTKMLNDNTYNYRVLYENDKKEALRMLKADPDAHFTDIGKTVYHPTFSNESIYSGKVSDYNPRGTVGGAWETMPIGSSDTLQFYIPSASQFENKDFNLDKTLKYLDENEVEPIWVSMINAPDNMLTKWLKDIKNSTMYAALSTFYPITSNYPFTGHSRLSVKKLNPDFSTTIKDIDKTMSDKDYNLITNNCSDATREGLECAFNQKMNPFLFTTPGDVLDFAIDELKGEKTYDGKDRSIVRIPLTDELKNRLLKYIEQGQKDNLFAEGGLLDKNESDIENLKRALGFDYHEGLILKQYD